MSLLPTPRAIWDPLCENMTPSTKPLRRTEPRPQLTCTENFVKFGHVVFETCQRTDIQTDIQTRSSQYFAPHRYPGKGAGGGRSNKCDLLSDCDVAQGYNAHAASAFCQPSSICSTAFRAQHFWPSASGFLSCRPYGLGLSPGFYPEPGDQYRLFQACIRNVFVCSI